MCVYLRMYVWCGVVVNGVGHVNRVKLYVEPG